MPQPADEFQILRDIGAHFVWSLRGLHDSPVRDRSYILDTD